MTESKTRQTGGCLCGGVRYRTTGPLRDPTACHCSQCRKSSGHYVAAARCDLENLHFDSDETLTWYRSSPHARRGFCSRCGSNLFWQADGRRYMSLGAGSLDMPSGLKLTHHIYVADKGDYYEITDGLPQYPGDDDA